MPIIRRQVRLIQIPETYQLPGEATFFALRRDLASTGNLGERRNWKARCGFGERLDKTACEAKRSVVAMLIRL